ncbi:MAG: LytTR family transcriptional regulator DNA-binding domain-containing protein [Clostridia bacterium]|nr:LytTR family transcriptional regulator DNA-binding domain-containing protein [Clostridia bacterium]
MKKKITVRFELDPACGAPEVIIRASRKTALTDRIASAVERCAEEESSPIMVFKGSSRSFLHQENIIRVHTELRRLIVCTESDEYEARCSLQELEEKLSPDRFVRISRFEIINIDWIASFDLSMAGTIQVVFENGSVTWVARRFVRAIQERLTMLAGKEGDSL